MIPNPSVTPAAYKDPAMIPDSAVYVDGRRTGPFDPDKSSEARQKSGGYVRVQLYKPPLEELHSTAQSLGLPEILVEGAAKSKQRSKLQRIKDPLFVVLKSARYLEKPEAVDPGEVNLFLGPKFVLVVSYGGDSSLQSGRAELKKNPGCSAWVRHSQALRTSGQTEGGLSQVALKHTQREPDPG